MNNMEEIEINISDVWIESLKELSEHWSAFKGLHPEMDRGPRRITEPKPSTFLKKLIDSIIKKKIVFKKIFGNNTKQKYYLPKFETLSYHLPVNVLQYTVHINFITTLCKKIIAILQKEKENKTIKYDTWSEEKKGIDMADSKLVNQETGEDQAESVVEALHENYQVNNELRF